MNKAIIIIISGIWLLCALYLIGSKVYNYPYQGYAMAGSWIASALLLVCIIIYARKHKGK